MYIFWLNFTLARSAEDQRSFWCEEIPPESKYYNLYLAEMYPIGKGGVQYIAKNNKNRG